MGCLLDFFRFDDGNGAHVVVVVLKSCNARAFTIRFLKNKKGVKLEIIS